MRIGEIRKREDLIPALKTALETRQELRRPYEAVWWNNIALVAGDHYASWNATMATFSDRDSTFDSELDGKQPRMVINQALSVFRTELSKLTKNHPVIEIVARSDEQEDLAATKVGRAVIDAVEWKFKLPKRRKEVLAWMIQCGTSSMYVGWDYLNEDAGEFEFVIDPQTNEVTFSDKRKKEIIEEAEKAGTKVNSQTFPLGDLDFKIYSPFQLYPSEFATSFEDLPDLITSEVADIDVIKDIYGSAARGLNPENATLGPQQERMLHRVGLSLPRDQQVENGAQVYTFWLRPSIFRNTPFLKSGLYVRWCQDKLLDWSEFPYQDARIPHAFYQHIPASGTIWADSVMNHIRDINLEIDKTVSQLVANKDYMANPMWRIATQHRVKGQVKNVAGAILRYVHSANIPPPEPIQGLQMPAQVENLAEMLRTAILEISGQSDISRGSVPTGVRSGVAVSYLQEEDDSKIAPTVGNLEDSIALEGSFILNRVAQYYNTRRIMGYYRRDGVFDVVKFKGADLKNNTDVISQAGSGMPKSKAARQQFTLELVQLGVLKDPKKIEERLDLGEAEPNLDDLQIAMANRENQMMLRGMSQVTFDAKGELAEGDDKPIALPVKKWHNHALHLEQHYREMSSEEFDDLAISDAEIVRLFDEHTAMHEQLQAEAMQQQMAALEAAKGAPGGQPAGQPPSSAFTEPVEGQPGAAGTGETQPTVDGAAPTDGSAQITNS